MPDALLYGLIVPVATLEFEKSRNLSHPNSLAL